MIVLALLILPTIILLATFELALKYPHAKLRLLIAATANVLANYGLLMVLFYDFPRWGEYTFSKRLPRLCNLPGWRGRFARRCKIYINKRVPGHIP